MPYRLQRSQTSPSPQTINRLGGLPLGVTQKEWPTIWDDMEQKQTPMVHVLTIDAKSINHPTARDIRAFALFASSADMFFYFDDPTADLTVLPLTQRAIAQGAHDPEPHITLLPSHSLLVEHTPEALKTNHAGGTPSWIQEEGPSQGLILQASDDLVGLNLGDSGQLYMYESWAMWQSY